MGRPILEFKNGTGKLLSHFGIPEWAVSSWNSIMGQHFPCLILGFRNGMSHCGIPNAPVPSWNNTFDLFYLELSSHGYFFSHSPFGIKLEVGSPNLHLSPLPPFSHLPSSPNLQLDTVGRLEKVAQEKTIPKIKRSKF